MSGNCLVIETFVSVKVSNVVLRLFCFLPPKSLVLILTINICKLNVVAEAVSIKKENSPLSTIIASFFES